MRRVCTMFFLSIYLLAATEIHQLLKLPVAIQHFAEHKKENKRIGFFAFIVLHYFSGNPKDRDYERDQQLPFKSGTDCMVSASPVLPVSPLPTSLEPVTFIVKNDFILKNDINFPLASPDAVFQPPRI